MSLSGATRPSDQRGKLYVYAVDMGTGSGSYWSWDQPPTWLQRMIVPTLSASESGAVAEMAAKTFEQFVHAYETGGDRQSSAYRQALRESLLALVISSRESLSASAAPSNVWHVLCVLYTPTDGREAFIRAYRLDQHSDRALSQKEVYLQVAVKVAVEHQPGGLCDELGCDFAVFKSFKAGLD